MGDLITSGLFKVKVCTTPKKHSEGVWAACGRIPLVTQFVLCVCVCLCHTEGPPTQLTSPVT